MLEYVWLESRGEKRDSRGKVHSIREERGLPWMSETGSRSVIDNLISVLREAGVDQSMSSEVFESKLESLFFALENAARSDSMQCSDIKMYVKR